MAGKRIGIYAGTFNPVHAGHVALALQAAEAARLDRLYFLPERQPRNKRGVEHFGHRVAMLKRALKPHPKLDILELPDVHFSVQRTLPRLQRLHSNDQLVFVFGSEVLEQLADWPYSERLISDSELVIGLRGHENSQEVWRLVKDWDTGPKSLTIIDSYAPSVSSSRIREALRLRQPVRGLLSSVARYSERNWLYVSLSRNT